MQRYIVVRLLQSLLTLWVMSLIVFSLARLTGDPLDVLLPMEAGEGERERIARHWGLDQPWFVNVAHPFETQYWTFVSKALRGDCGSALCLHRPAYPVSVTLAWTSRDLPTLSWRRTRILPIPAGFFHALSPDILD